MEGRRCERRTVINNSGQTKRRIKATQLHCVMAVGAVYAVKARFILRHFSFGGVEGLCMLLQTFPPAAEIDLYICRAMM
jgi:hypothetical protein